MLAERARERLDLSLRSHRVKPGIEYDHYAKLSRLAREVLEVANG